MRKYLLAMFVLLGTTVLMNEAYSQQCPVFTSSTQALRYLRENQRTHPQTTAECFDKALVSPPAFAADTDFNTWRTYLWEGAQFLHRMADSSDLGPVAKREYKKSESRTLEQYREKTLERLLAESRTGALDLQVLQTEYAKGVDAESNILWQSALHEDRGLLNLQQFLSNLDPTYLLDPTAVRWLEAARTCPNWVPATTKQLPDYATAWCKADCQDHFETLASKLTIWMSKVPEHHTLQSYKWLKRRTSEIKSFCKQTG